ncbi:MAG: methyltransferase domain-containing protein [Treponema sp.]|nr:methyltransferase domain-containing protein [Treponema sp.]
MNGLTKKVVIIQCRMSSTRLPGKALMDLGGKTVLAWVLQSMKKLSCDDFYVATDSESYPLLEPVCLENGVKIFQGSLNNVLNRYCECIKEAGAHIVVRATADNPYLFYEAAQYSLDLFEKMEKEDNPCDYLTLTGLPHGSGVEVFFGDSLLEAEKNTSDPYDQEHAGPALYRHKDIFRCEFIESDGRFNFPDLRSTIDTYSDYIRAVCVNRYLLKKGIDSPYKAEDIVKALSCTEVQRPLVFVPSVKKGQGTGHLMRCISLAKKCALSRPAFIYIEKNDDNLSNLSELIQSGLEGGLEKWQVLEKIPGDENFRPVFVTDRFITEEKLQKELSEKGTVISIDEGASDCTFSDYVLDVIPPYFEKSFINHFEPSFMELPSNKKSISDDISNILVCFGGEDPAGLTEKSLSKVKDIFPSAKITCISRNVISGYDNVVFTGPVENLSEKLWNYDLVVTHYGLTAWEALSAGCKVFLGATSDLHKNLAEKYNFPLMEKLSSRKDFESAWNSEKNPSELVKDQKSLFEFIDSLSKGQKLSCPVCRNIKDSSKDKILERNIFRTYRTCSKCGMNYISYTVDEKQREYSKDYFFDQYKNQYGKTYKEDFEHIKEQCLKRMDFIEKVSVLPEKTVLDIGCAYGPFLKAASEKGYEAFGTDICDDAVEFVKNDLGFKAVTGAFPELDTDALGKDSFSAVTMWYVIEHFQDLDSVLKKVSGLVKKDGVFAFSTPSASGVSGTRNTHDFYIQSPDDHYSVWDYNKADAVLSKYGFHVVKVVSTGHHPERFPYVKKHGTEKNSFVWKIIDKYSRMKKLGDTVEIYCRKN